MSLLRATLKTGNATSVESVISLLSKNELNAEFSSTTDNRTIVMLAIESKNPKILEIILGAVPDDLIRIQLESTNPQKTLIELSLDNLAGDNLTMILDQLKKHPDLLQKQIYNKNILINALRRKEEHILLQTLELLQKNKPIYKSKIHGLSTDFLKELLFQLNEILNYGPLDESKLKLLDGISREIACSPKFTDEVKLKLLEVVSHVQEKLGTLVKETGNLSFKNLQQQIESTPAIQQSTQATDNLNKQASLTNLKNPHY